MKAALLDDRGVLEVSGADAEGFLHNLVSCAVEGTRPGEARYGALLTPQGKIITDFLLLATQSGFLLDVPAARMAELVKRLTFYRLRAKVQIADRSAELRVAALWGAAVPPALPDLFADPRLPALGFRAFLPAADAPALLPGLDRASPADWHEHRIGLGIPEGGADFAFGDAFPHEADMDQLHGVDFRKGCYIGQEVVSRMQHRGTARTRAVPVEIVGPVPPAGSEVRAGEKPAGTLGSTSGARGIALLRLDRAEDVLAAGGALAVGDATLRIRKPGWAHFRFPGEPAAEVKA